MQDKDIRALNEFKCEYNRLQEEDFARLFSSNNEVSFNFSDDGIACTNGSSIYVPPGLDNIFCDDDRWKKAVAFLKSKGLSFTLDYTIRENTLHWITRALSMHESSHILYTNFPSVVLSHQDKPRFYVNLLSAISNIIEDTFVDNATIEAYDYTWMYIYVLRVVSGIYHMPCKSKNPADRLCSLLLRKYAFFMFDLDEVDLDIKPHFEAVCKIFDVATLCGDPDRRDKYSIEATNYIVYKVYGLTDEQLEEISEAENYELEAMKNEIEKLLSGTMSGNNNLEGYSKKGAKIENVKISVAEKSKDIEELKEAIKKTEATAVSEVNRMSRARRSNNGNVKQYIPESITDKSIHKNITLIETVPPASLKIKLGYELIKTRYMRDINRYNRIFARIFTEKEDVYINKQYTGNVLSSHNLSDVKRRYWTRKEDDDVITDAAITFMLDGSGSMKNNDILAREALIVVHETLKKFQIKHSIVQFMAVYGQDRVEHNILLPFNANAYSEYNILLKNTLQNTREGISLLWAKEYMEKQRAKHNFIVVISDGLPYHAARRGLYRSPDSVEDARDSRIRLEKSGYKVIAIALNGCYEQLTSIYRNVVDCSDIKSLSDKLFKVIMHEINMD